MRKSNESLIAVAAVTLGLTLAATVSAAPHAADPNANVPNSPTLAQGDAADKATPDKATPAAADERALRTEMATVVEDATTSGRFDQLVHQFARGNRPADDGAKARQTKDAVKGERDELEAAIDRFQKDWKEKYAQDFNLRGNEAKVFSEQFARIDVGDFGDAARTAGAKIAPSTPPATGKSGAPAKVDNRAVVTIAESHGSPAVVLRFVQEGAAWKLEPAKAIDPAALRAAVVRGLQQTTAGKVHWPADQDEAYRVVAHRVFSAITEATGSGEAEAAR